MLTPELRKYAGIEKDVKVVGVSTRIEVWDAAKWDMENDYDETALSIARENVSRFITGLLHGAEAADEDDIPAFGNFLKGIKK